MLILETNSRGYASILLGAVVDICRFSIESCLVDTRSIVRTNGD